MMTAGDAFVLGFVFCAILAIGAVVDDVIESRRRRGRKARK